MKQFRKILRFELKNYLTNKVFVGVTVFLMIAIVAVMFFPRMKEALSGGDGESAQSRDKSVMLLVADNAEAALPVFGAAFGDYRVEACPSAEEAQERILSGEAECAFALDGTKYTYYVNNLTMTDGNMEIASAALTAFRQMEAMQDLGLSPQEAAGILGTVAEGEAVNLGQDQLHNFFYTYIMIFALYMVILLYGQMVATNVATEKSSRAMELLITSANPTSMMFGKVIASCLAGLIQLVAVFGSSLVCFGLNRTYWSGNPIVTSIFDMPTDLFVYMLVFFVLGFLIYAFLYGAIGSTASKLEDINTSVMPVTMLFVVGFIVVITAMTSGNLDGGLIRACSFIPFTSPMAMFTRIAMSVVPLGEIAASIAILVLSTAAIGFLSARIYRVGVLLYGTPPKIGAIIRAVRRA